MANLPLTSQSDAFTQNAFGFASGTRLDAQKQRRKERAAEFTRQANEQAALLPQNDRGVFSSFAQLGNQLAQSLDSESPLSQDEQRQFDIMEGANEQIKIARASEDFKKLTPEQQAFKVQQIVANKSAEFGDIESFSRLSLDLFNKKQARKRALSEQDLLEGEVDAQKDQEALDRVNIDTRKEAFRVMKEGAPHQFVMPGPDGGFSQNPDLRMGIMNNRGDIVDAETGQPMPGAITLETWDTVSDNFTNGLKGSGSGNPLKDFVNNIKERDKLRAQSNDYLVAGDVIAKAGSAIASTANPEGIVGSAGTLVKFVDNMNRLFRGTARNFSGKGATIVKRDTDGNVIPGSQTSLEAMTKDLASEIRLPASIGEQSAEAARYRSAIMQAVYVDARLEEPGARQLSDADIKNAMDRLGVSSNNPEVVMSVLLEGYNQRASTTKARFSDAINVGVGGYGLSRDKATAALFGTDPIPGLEAAQERANTVFSNVFAGITPPDTSIVTDTTSPAPAASSANLVRVDENGDIIQ